MLTPSTELNTTLDQKPATHVIPQQLIVDKIPGQKLAPVKVHPKDKLTLNPQPISPNTGKKLIRTKGL